MKIKDFTINILGSSTDTYIKKPYSTASLISISGLYNYSKEYSKSILPNSFSIVAVSYNISLVSNSIPNKLVEIIYLL